MPTRSGVWRCNPKPPHHPSEQTAPLILRKIAFVLRFISLPHSCHLFLMNQVAYGGSYWVHISQSCMHGHGLKEKLAL